MEHAWPKEPISAGIESQTSSRFRAVFLGLVYAALHIQWIHTKEKAETKSFHDKVFTVDSITGLVVDQVELRSLITEWITTIVFESFEQRG